MKSSTDIWFIGYLKYLGYAIESFDVISKGKVKCNFLISDIDWNKLRLEFANSQFIKYKVAVEQVKDLAW